MDRNPFEDRKLFLNPPCWGLGLIFEEIYMQFDFAQTTGLTNVFGIETGSYASVSVHIRSISDHFSRRVWLWGSEAPEDS